MLSFLVTLLLLRRVPGWRRFGSWLLLGSPLTLALLVLYFLTFSPTAAGARTGVAGLTERILVIEVYAWFEAVASTLAYDNAIMGDGTVPIERIASVTTPTLIIDGGASPAFMHNAAQAAAGALPNAQRLTLEGQMHDVAPAALAPVLVAFFKG